MVALNIFISAGVLFLFLIAPYQIMNIKCNAYHLFAKAKPKWMRLAGAGAGAGGTCRSQVLCWQHIIIFT